MRLHVPVEVSGLGEVEGAEMALVGFDAGVSAQMFGEGGGVGESLGAVSASIGPLSGVRPLVSDEGGALRERTSADRARKRLFTSQTLSYSTTNCGLGRNPACVDATMGSEVGGLRERLATVSASQSATQ